MVPFSKLNHASDLPDLHFLVSKRSFCARNHFGQKRANRPDPRPEKGIEGIDRAHQGGLMMAEMNYFDELKTSLEEAVAHR